MFNAIEAINDIIDDINDDVAEYAESCYEEIYDELCYRVECGDLTLEEAEMINDAAYDKYVSEAARYKVEQERLARKMHNEEKNIINLKLELERIANIRKTLIKNGEFEQHKNKYEEIKNDLLSKIQQSTELLKKMRKSKLYTGEENVTCVKPDGSKVDKKLFIGSTLNYGKIRAKEEAEAREDIKRHGFAVVDGTDRGYVKQMINVRKKRDKQLGLTS